MTNGRQGATGTELAERASAISLDWARKVVTVQDCGIEDLLEVVEVEEGILLLLFAQTLNSRPDSANIVQGE